MKDISIRNTDAQTPCMWRRTSRKMEEKDVYSQDVFNPYAFRNEKSDSPVWLVTFTNAQKYDSISSQLGRGIASGKIILKNIHNPAYLQMLYWKICFSYK